MQFDHLRILSYEGLSFDLPERVIFIVDLIDVTF